MRSPRILAREGIKRADDILKLVHSDDFKKAWEHAGGKGNMIYHRQEVNSMISRNDAHGVSWWIKCELEQIRCLVKAR